MAGTVAAWTGGEDWLSRVRGELLDRRDRLAERVTADMPGVRLDTPEATYLAWLDFSATAIAEQPSYRLLKEAGVALSEGALFGPRSEGFARLNFATSAEILDDLVDRIAELLART